MAIEGRAPRDELVQRIMRQTLGSLIDWSEPVINKTVGPYFPHVFKEHAKERDNLLRECSEYLENFDDELLATKFGNEGWAAKGEDQNWQAGLRNKADSWGRREPFRLEGGFGRTDHDADFGYWSKMAHLTLHEAVCLSLGVEPEMFDKEGLQQAFDSAKKLHPTIDYLRLRREQIRREFDPYDNGYSIDPHKFRAWVDRVQLDVPDKFLQVIGRVDVQIPAATAAGNHRPSRWKGKNVTFKTFGRNGNRQLRLCS